MLRRPHLLMLLACIAGAVALWPRVAAAATEAAQLPLAPAEGDVAVVELGGSTIAPLAIGGEARVEFAVPLQLHVHLGWMPPAYAAAINEVGKGLGGWDEQRGRLIEDGLANSFVFSTWLAVRPFPELGFEVLAGYAFVGAGGSSTRSSGVRAIGGLTLFESRETYNIRTNIHALRAGFGWRWHIEPSVVFRVELALLYTFDATTRLTNEDLSQREREAEQQLDEEIRDLLTSYGIAPTLGVSFAYRF